MRGQTFLLLLSLLFTFYTSLGQEGKLELYQNGFYIKQYSEISGLASNSCKRVFEDSRGLLWINTPNGLSRFDGKQFVNFGTNEGLPSPNIIQVCEDSLGYIYVATPKGFARYTGYNKANGSYFYVYPQTKAMNGPFHGIQAVDSNTILFQADKSSVFLLDNGKIRKIGHPSKGEGGARIYHSNYRYYYSYVTDTIRVFDALFKNIDNIYNKDSGHAGESIDSSGKFHIYYKGVKRILKGNKIIHTSSVPDSIVWFGCADSLDQIVYSKNDIIYYYANGKSKMILDLKSLSLICSSVIVTRDGSIWVGTNAGGLFRITRLSYEDIATPGYFFHYRNNQKIIITNEAPGNRLFTNEDLHLASGAQVVLRDRDNITWFCTQEGIYKKEPGKRTMLYSFPGQSSFWNENATRILDAVETPGGDIWFYGYPGIIHYHNGEFRHYKERNGLIESGVRIRNLEVDADGTVLFIDHFSRLFYIQGDTVLNLINIAGLQDVSPDKIRKDGKGYLWIEHNKQLYKIRKQSTGNYITIDSIAQNPLTAGAEIKSYSFDGKGNCWMGYAGGKMQVFFVDAAGRYHHTNSIIYTIDDGLARIGASQYNLCLSEDGNMAVIPSGPGAGKLFLFSVEDALSRKKIKTLQVSLTEILINHEQTDWSDMGYLTNPAGVPFHCKLHYTDNSIIFNYTSTSVNNPGSVMYQTILKGYDDKWRTTTGTMAVYTNLSPGKYIFLVKAANVNGVWGDAYEYAFTISPPWYKTWWATLLWIVVCSSVILFLVFLRINSIRMSNLKENNTFKSSLIGLIGHDMMTPLSYIAKVSSQLKTYNNKLSRETTLDSLSDITVTASRLQFFGESILHWINLQNSEYSPAMSRFHVNKTIEYLVEFHQLLAIEKGNIISHELPDELICYQDATLVKIIVHNLLLNANKFTTHGMIKVSAILENDWLVIKVKDNGKGMEQSKVDSLNQFQPIMSSPGTLREKGWGLGYKMIIDLLKFSNGTLHVKSKLNEGTEVTIKLLSGNKEYTPKLKVA